MTPVATSDIPRLRRNSVRSLASNNSAPSFRTRGTNSIAVTWSPRHGQQTNEVPKREFSGVASHVTHRVIREAAELTYDRAPPVPLDSIEPTVATAQVKRRSCVDYRFGESLLPCVEIGTG